jgi:ATP-dependent Clp protease adaptor protein ClpS
MLKEKKSPEKNPADIFQDERELVLFNDEFNTFDFVIDALIEVCGHDVIQAEQCTLIAHHKGKCGVKTGTRDELQPMWKGLADRNLTAEIH